MSNLKIVTIGGGTGAPAIIEALIRAGFTHISAISTATDTGGRSGRVRTDERDRIISIGDLIKNLMALISPSQKDLPQVRAFIDMFDFTDGRYRNLGYQIYYALLEKYANDFLQVQAHLERLLGIHFSGSAIPVTLSPTHISFLTMTGAIYHGEHELDRQSMSANTIQKIWLDHRVAATPEAISAIKEASYIIFCPGSIYGSVIVNLLPSGITAALKSSPSVKILISNLVSNRNQTHQYSPLDYYRLFKKYTRFDPPFNIFISPDITQVEFENKYPRVAANYATEHSNFLGWDNGQLAALAPLKIKSVTCNCIAVTPELSRIRHCPEALSQLFKQLIQTT